MLPIEGIYGFFGPHRFLSNFWYADVYLDEECYPTVEHAYQAAKTYNLADREFIQKLPSPSLAKQRGGSVEIRADWEKVKVAIMSNLIAQKFQDPDLRLSLLQTGDIYLEETNTWGDTFWGVCKGKGKNVLGNLLMDRRRIIQDITLPW